jgi:hypothetical protein
MPGQVGLPTVFVPAIREDFSFNHTWFRFLQLVWSLLGGGRNVLADAVYLQYDSTSGHLLVYQASDGTLLGHLVPVAGP